MKTNDKKTINLILAHKEYFDHRLVEIVQKLTSQNLSLSDSLALKQAQIVSLKRRLIASDNKVADLSSINETLQTKKNEADEKVREFEEILRQMKKEIEEIRKENDANLEEIERLRKEAEKNNREIQRQKKIINKLQEVNSTNSNMPSSEDILSHSVPKERKSINSRQKSELPRGGQKGHAAHVSSLGTADRIEEIRVKKAPLGAEAVRDDKGIVLYYRTQEIDFVMRGIVKETRYYVDSDKGSTLPDEIMNRYKINPVGYTAGFKSAMIYLNHKGTIPLQRLSDILKDLSDNKINIKPSTIVKWENELLQSGRKEQEEVLRKIQDGKVVHVDETSVKINEKQYWLHTISNESGIFYTITQKRCDKENGPLYLLKDYSNVLVHDHLKSYYTLTGCMHAECNAHIQRYLQSGIDFENSEACAEILEILQTSLHKKHELQKLGYTRMSEEEVIVIREKMNDIMKAELKRYAEEHLDIEKKYEEGHIKLFRRMMEYIDEHLLFLRDFDVPYTNNEAERSCRKVKTKKNISKQFGSLEGAQAYATAITVIETARITGKNPLREIERIIER